MARVPRRWQAVFLISSLAVVSISHRAWAGENPMGAAADETAIRKIIQDEDAAWNRGDATAYSRQFAADGTFTNIRGQFFEGYDAFLKQHEVIFGKLYKNTVLQQDIVSLKFIRPDVAVVETLSSVSGIQETAPGTSPDSKGRLRTRLLQVVAKQSGEWKIVGITT